MDCYDPDDPDDPDNPEMIVSETRDGGVAFTSQWSDLFKEIEENPQTIKFRDECRRNILLHAVRDDKKLQLIKFLVDKGSEINIQDYTGRTPLMQAVFNGNMEIVQFLVDNGAVLGLKDGDDKTALQIAEDKEHKDIAKFLLQKQKQKLKPTKACKPMNN